ncbi:SH3 domain-containing protein [bacterium]|nr:SH3 domain-containing protein [bacterium]
MQSAVNEPKYLSLEVPRKIALALLFILLFLLPALSYAAMAPRGMDNPGHWISRMGTPDEIVLTPEEVRAFNIAAMGVTDQMADLRSMPDTLPGETVFEWIWTDFLADPGKKYDSKGRKLPESFFIDLVRNINLDGIGNEVKVRHGVVAERADMRGLPTYEAVLSKPGREGFDSIQYSSLYPPARVLLLHTSEDGEWGFFQAETLRGWLRMDKVAFGERNAVMSAGDEEFLVVTGNRVRVYGDSALEKPMAEVVMGGVLAVSTPAEGNFPWTVRFPERRKDGSLSWIDGYIKPDAEVSLGYLPYTRSNIIRQAFKMLGEEYGWGGRSGLRDCSLFIQDIFATVGVKLPRNSRQQGVTGEVLAHLNTGSAREDVALALRGSDPGVTLLTLDGHVMLYLGQSGGKPYVIHQIFGYADRGGMRRVGRVAVTGLDLGSRSPIGSMKLRLRGVTRMTIPEEFRIKTALDKQA